MLSASFVRTVNQAGSYGDGRGGFGLTLRVKERVNGRIAKQWVQRLRWQGKPFNMGLGAYPLVNLSEARAAALGNARMVAKGIDPRGGGVPNFAVAAETVIGLHEPTWKGGSKTGVLWRSTLAEYAFPVIGRKTVDAIATADVLAVLVPLLRAKPETGRKVRQRISAVMRWAVAEGHRQDDPAGPALSAALPKDNGKRQHHRALPYKDVAAALATVEASGAALTTKACLRFVTLTAVRSGEARGATWAEIDMDAATWIVPAERMKTGKPHRVPLSDAALAVIGEAAELADGSGLVFPSVTGRALSDNALSKLFRDLGLAGTPHGLRSSFRDWCAETGQPREIAEAALAHTVAGVEGAYFRSDLFSRRRDLMQAWATYLTP